MNFLWKRENILGDTLTGDRGRYVFLDSAVMIKVADKPKVGTEGREVDLISCGFPFVSEVFFLQESDEWSMLKIRLHIVGWQGK